MVSSIFAIGKPGISHKILLSFFLIHLTNCRELETQERNAYPPDKSWQVWGACFGAVLVVSLTGLIVVGLVPLMSSNYYNVVTQYLIALSVGSLTGDAFMHLIPHALFPHDSHNHNTNCSHDHSDEFDRNLHKQAVFKGIVLLLGIHAFFITERVTILWQNYNSRKKMKKTLHENAKLRLLQSNDMISSNSNKTGPWGPYDRLEFGEGTDLNREKLECQFDNCREHGQVLHQPHSEDERIISTGTSMARNRSHYHLYHHSHYHQIPKVLPDKKKPKFRRGFKWDLRKSTSQNSISKSDSSDQSYKSHDHNMSPQDHLVSSTEGVTILDGGMRSHVGGVDTAPPTEMIVHCHHSHVQKSLRNHKQRRTSQDRLSADLDGFSTDKRTIWSKLTARRLSDKSQKSLDLIKHNIYTPKNGMLNNKIPLKQMQNLTVNNISLSSNMPAESKNSLTDLARDEHSKSLSRLQNGHSDIISRQQDCLISHSNSALHRDCCLTGVSDPIFKIMSEDEENRSNKIALGCSQLLGGPEIYNQQSEDICDNGKLEINRSASLSQSKRDRSFIKHHSHCYSVPQYVPPLRDKPHGHHHGHSHDLSNIRSIAYTIIAGDGLHNFCDGIAIGAAFATNLYSGASTFIAVLCHEIPHELGDFAVLLNAGMSVKTALFYNFLTVIFCFMGMIIGILLGSIDWLATWLIMITAGMFVYIALVDMVPELATQRLKGKRQLHSPLVLFICQNAGIFSGFLLMFLIAQFIH